MPELVSELDQPLEIYMNSHANLITAAVDVIKKISVATEEQQDEIFVAVSLEITRQAFVEQERGISGVCTRLFENIVENPISNFESLSEAEATVKLIVAE